MKTFFLAFHFEDLVNPLQVKYQCEWCGKIFDGSSECRYHEKDEHECPKCKHSYYVYGCEFECSRLRDNKKCKFEVEKKGGG